MFIVSSLQFSDLFINQAVGLTVPDCNVHQKFL
jgi:hypothetical protein